MPTNLTYPYRKAEGEYRRAATAEEELRCLQLMLRELPKHKGTDKLQAELKRKISKSKKEVEQEKKYVNGNVRRIRIPRQGAGRVVVIGGPSAGKSQFIRSVTRANPEVAAYPFTTQEPLPAMMPWEDIFIQLIDTPPITKDFFDPVTQGLVRGADLVLLFVDLGIDEGLDHFQDLCHRMRQTKTQLARESRLSEKDIGLSFTRAVVCLNKIDADEAVERSQLAREMVPVDLPVFLISGERMDGIEKLKAAVFQLLDIVRVYTKMPNKKTPDYKKPFTIRRGGNLQEIARLIHQDVAAKLKGARVWGSAVDDGIMVKNDYVLCDQDVVELHV
ncbi:MAG: 50S ribosome-binding GTPase [Pirellulaceae bacterium]|nr:50S ribosome-binding GTPase [Pirellulaceae bacterium]